MNTNRRAVFAILIAAMLALAGLLLREFLLVHVVQPVALMLWIGYRVIASIDQSVYWAGLILALVGFSLLRLLRQAAADGAAEEENPINATLNSIYHWRTLILLTSDETTKLNYLKQSLQRLLKEVYASKQPAEVRWKIYQEVEQGDIPLPESIRTFLLLDPPAQRCPSLAQRLAQIRQAPARLVRRGTKRDQADYYQSIAEVIAFMENELENADDG